MIRCNVETKQRFAIALVIYLGMFDMLTRLVDIGSLF